MWWWRLDGVGSSRMVRLGAILRLVVVKIHSIGFLAVLLSERCFSSGLLAPGSA